MSIHKMYQKKESYRNLLLFFSILMLLFIVNGCGTAEGSVKKLTDPFIGGTQGLVIQFDEVSIPEEVFDNGNFPFQLVVNLKNEGEFNLKKEKVKVSLSGVNTRVFNVALDSVIDIQPAEDPTSIIRDEKGNIIQEPAEIRMTFPSETTDFDYKDKLPSGDIADFDFIAEVCYAYQTEARSQICVLKDIFTVTEDAICNPREEKDVFNSGSPVKVSSLRQTVVSKDKTKFSFVIDHIGNGKIYGKDTIDDNDIKNAKDAIKGAVDALIGITDIKLDGLNTELSAATTSLRGATPNIGDAKSEIDAAKIAVDAIVLYEITDQTPPADIDRFEKFNEAIPIVKAKINNALTALTIQLCPKTPDDKRNKKSRVNVTVNTGLTAGTLDCVGLDSVGGTSAQESGIVKLVNGNKHITCTQNLASDKGDFPQFIVITLDFNYFDKTEKGDATIFVKHLE